MQPEGVTLLLSPIRRRLVDALAAGGPKTAAELGKIVDLHVTTSRFHLEQLLAAGIVEASYERQDRPGRPRKMYAASSGSFETSDRRDRAAMDALAAVLVGGFGDSGISPVEAGRQWATDNIPAAAEGPATTAGQFLTKVAQMVDVLSKWGYQPEVHTTNAGRTAAVTLDHCPFLELAKRNPAVVCGIHRGLIAGAMERLGEEGTEVGLEPFVEPSRCRAHLTTTTPFS